MSEMSGDIKRKLAGQNPELRVDLKEMFDLPFFPESDALRQAIGQSIIDRIKERTEVGNFLAESKGAQRYSKEYVESFEFKVYGKEQGRVNLRASGDMLENMSLELETNFNFIKVYFPDSEQAQKAHGHITGNVGKKRDFFGLTQRDINQIRREYEDQVIDAFTSAQVGETLSRQRTDQSDLDFVLGRLSDEN